MHRAAYLVTHISLTDCTRIHLTGVPTASVNVVSSLLLLLMPLQVTFVILIYTTIFVGKFMEVE